MESTTLDLTNFWLAWRKTCSIRLCTESHRGELRAACEDAPELAADAENISRLALKVMGITNARFREMIAVPHGLRRSEFAEETLSWNAEGACGSAFELVESRLYAKQKLNGRKFKDYLFEDIANRPGGIGKNLLGYLNRILATIAEESFGENVYEPRVDGDGLPIPPQRISFDGKNDARCCLTPQQQFEAKEVAEFFGQYVENHSPEWSDDHWVVLFCILHLIPVGGAKIRPLFSRGHDAVNTICNRMKADLLAALQNSFSVAAIGAALDGPIQDLLDKKMCEKPFYGELQKVFRENQLSTGK